MVDANIDYGADGVKRGEMKFLIGGGVLIVLWILGLFVARMETGWVHTPLAAGAVLIAVGIVVADEERRRK
jgi:hypothetical protein